jgi:hypothetical protein
MSEQSPTSKLKARGFFRLHIVDEDGTITGDSGWVENLVTRHGFQHMLLNTGTSLTGTKYSHVNVGTGGAPVTNAVALPNEVLGTGGVVIRQVPTASTLAGSVTLRNLATMSSANSFISSTGGETINNVGIFNHSSASSLCAGASYTASACASNQNVDSWRHLLATVRSKLAKFGEHLSQTIPSQAPAYC